MIEAGSIVVWCSQSNGIWKRKVGKVVGVYEFRGKPRYRVEVKQDNGVPKYYEPWPSQLTKVF